VGNGRVTVGELKLLVIMMVELEAYTVVTVKVVKVSMLIELSSTVTVALGGVWLKEI